MQASLLSPVLALVLWSFVMWAWLYATRIPAIFRAKLDMDPRKPKGWLESALPPEVNWKADNYNHLMEQPTLFYATVLAFAVAGGASSLDVMLAWAYVALRVVHSLVQATVNAITLRFAIFMVSSCVLLALAIRTAMHVM